MIIWYINWFGTNFNIFFSIILFSLFDQLDQGATFLVVNLPLHITVRHLFCLFRIFSMPVFISIVSATAVTHLESTDQVLTAFIRAVETDQPTVEVIWPTVSTASMAWTSFYFKCLQKYFLIPIMISCVEMHALRQFERVTFVHGPRCRLSSPGGATLLERLSLYLWFVGRQFQSWFEYIISIMSYLSVSLILWD